MSEIEIGTISHYFAKIGVAGVKLSDRLAVGDRVHILGHTTDLVQPVESIQIDHVSVHDADDGAEIGLSVADHVREHDKVYRIE